MYAAQEREYLLIDCTGCRGRDLALLYRDFAVACVQRQLERALVKADGGDPEDHLSLRDALTVVMLAGMPDGFRIALVTGTGPMEAVFRALQSDLRRLRIQAAVFGREDDAREWLLSHPRLAALESEAVAGRLA